jgi:hypothetical protein
MGSNVRKRTNAEKKIVIVLLDGSEKGQKLEPDLIKSNLKKMIFFEIANLVFN